MQASIYKIHRRLGLYGPNPVMGIEDFSDFAKKRGRVCAADRSMIKRLCQNADGTDYHAAAYWMIDRYGFLVQTIRRQNCRLRLFDRVRRNQCAEHA